MSKPNFFCAALSMSKWSRGSTNELERLQASTQVSLTIGLPVDKEYVSMPQGQCNLLAINNSLVLQSTLKEHLMHE